MNTKQTEKHILKSKTIWKSTDQEKKYIHQKLVESSLVGHIHWKLGKIPSGIRVYIENWKDLSSNPTTYSAGLWDPTFLYKAPSDFQVKQE